jgi:DNA-binding beta-propeller fold protein YncE
MGRVSAALGVAALLLLSCGTPTADRSIAPTRASTNGLLVLSGPEGVEVLDVASGTVTQRGKAVGAPGWGKAFAADVDAAGNTSLHVFDIASGAMTRTIALAGRWAPVGESVAGPSGFSANGRWLAVAATDLSGDFLVVDTTQGSVRKVTAGRAERPDLAFTFDALSDDGQSLYLVEHLSGTSYRVRVVDVRSGLLVPGAVIDVKQLATTADESGVMNGTYTSAVAGPAGEWLFSVYQHPTKGPYVHALNTHTRIAECILDLPTFGTAGPRELAKQAFWSVALGDRQGIPWIYAVNAALGHVALIDPSTIKVKKTATLAVGSATSSATGYLPRSGAVVSPDGYRLYAVGENGVLVIDTADLSLRASFFKTAAFRSLAVSADNSTLFALGADGGAVSALDAHTGQPIRTFTLRAHAEAIALLR